MEQMIMMQRIGGVVLVLLLFLWAFVAIYNDYKRSAARAKRRAELLATLPIDIQPDARWMSVDHLEAMNSAQLTPDQQKAVVLRRLDVGLPPLAVQAIWGPPHDIDRKGGKGGDVLIYTWWERGDKGRKKIDKRVTFRNGALETWEDR